MEKVKKILIVDSDTNNIVPLKMELSKAGYEVICWDDGQKALELAKSLQADLIISEVDLPQVNGHVLFKELHSIPACKSIPFIFLSNQKRVDDRIKSMELGVDDYITKPYYVEEVVARVDALFNEIILLQDDQTQTDKGFSGSLTEMNLVDLIQTIELGKKSAVLKLQHNSQIGLIYIDKGEVIDAALDDLTPQQSLMRMFTWTIGTFYVEISELDRDRKIDTPNKELITIGMKRSNEWEQLKQGLPSLNAVVVKTDRNSYEELSEDEQDMVSNLEKKNVLYNLIERSRFDDLKALELVKKLYQKGYLQETKENYVPYMDDYANRLKKKASLPRTTTERVTSLVTNVFKKQDEDNAVEKRNNERRLLSERRRSGRRRFDRIEESCNIHLTKSELLMIRERLM